MEKFVARYRCGLPALPAPATDEWDWQLRARCRTVDPAIFFPPARGPERTRSEREAKAICAGCPVLHTCRRYAVQAKEPHGIWGGLSARERALLELHASVRHPRDNQQKPSRESACHHEPPDSG
nr:WhiB family transcriptional regulator [Skermania sp. ID1734]